MDNTRAFLPPLTPVPAFPLSGPHYFLGATQVLPFSVHPRSSKPSFLNLHRSQRGVKYERGSTRVGRCHGRVWVLLHSPNRRQHIPTTPSPQPHHTSTTSSLQPHTLTTSPPHRHHTPTITRSNLLHPPHLQTLRENCNQATGATSLRTGHRSCRCNQSSPCTQSGSRSRRSCS